MSAMQLGKTDLNSPPPSASTGTNLMKLEKNAQGPAPPSPHTATMLGMSMLEQGARLISSSLPGLAPALSQMTIQLRTILPRAMAELGTTGAPGALAAPPPPPQGGAQGAGPQPGGMPQ